MHFLLTSKTPLVDHRTLIVIASACLISGKSLAAAWDRKPPTITALKNIEDWHQQKASAILTIVDRSTAEGALGWHTKDDGRIFGEIAAEDILSCNGIRKTSSVKDRRNATLRGPSSVAAIIDHEIKETFIDPDVNVWCDRPDGKTEDALEVCDAVQGSSYNITVRDGKGFETVSVSNFLLPAWFDNEHPEDAKFDFLGLCKNNHEVLPGGYHVIRKIGQVLTEDGPPAAIRAARATAPRIVDAVEGTQYKTKGVRKRRVSARFGRDIF